MKLWPRFTLVILGGARRPSAIVCGKDEEVLEAAGQVQIADKGPYQPGLAHAGGQGKNRVTEIRARNPPRWGTRPNEQ